jgi:dTDP-4-dehydrorhamnose reductase
MDSVIVTGASGFLGQYMLEATATSYDVVGTYFRTEITHPTVETHQVDLTEPPFDSLREFDPDYIIHCAGLTDVDECERNPQRARELNVQMTEHVASLAAETDAHLAYISTDAVFDGTESWFSEDASPNPINVYGETKHEGEQAAMQGHDTVTVVRTNFFGWTASGDSTLAEWMLETLDSGGELSGFEDVYFTPIYAGELAHSIVELLTEGHTGLVHLAGSERLSKLEFAHTLADVFGYSSSSIMSIQVSDLDLDADRGRDLSLDSSHAESLLGRSLPDCRTGLKRMKQERSP